MKTLQFAIIFCSVSLSLFGQSLKTIETYYDPYVMSKIKEKYTVETAKMQKHGKYQEWDSDGYLIAEATFSNGKLNGIVTTYYGASAYILELVDDKNQLGKISKVETYKNGVKHGISKEFDLFKNKYTLKLEQMYDNGNLVRETEYYENEKKKQTLQVNGLCQVWYENGMKYAEYSQKNGVEEGPMTSYYENGQVFQKGTNLNGKPVGTWATYTKGGKLIMQGVSNNDGLRTGFWKIYYNAAWKEVYEFDSALYYREITFDVSGKPQGIVTDFYISGKKQWEGQLLSLDPDVFEGECTFYYENGQIASHQSYKDKHKSGLWESYYENGQITEKVTFINNKPDGQYRQWWENGKVKQEGVYKMGKTVGDWKFYNEDGSLGQIDTHKN
jgi:uncharacterized protein